MDELQQQSDRDADNLTRNAKVEGDLSIYIFALIATVVLTVGLFAWIMIDPIVPTTAPAQESSELPG